MVYLWLTFRRIHHRCHPQLIWRIQRTVSIALNLKLLAAISKIQSIWKQTLNPINLLLWLAGNGEDEDVDQGPDSIFAYPHNASGLMKFWWVFVFPIKLILRCLIPHPIRHRRLYPLSFIMCIITIGANAYVIVWMLTAFGVAIRVPTIVMGLTFLAAGSTMPEAVSSLISLRNGKH